MIKIKKDLEFLLKIVESIIGSDLKELEANIELLQKNQSTYQENKDSFGMSKGLEILCGEIKQAVFCERWKQGDEALYAILDYMRDKQK